MNISRKRPLEEDDYSIHHNRVFNKDLLIGSLFKLLNQIKERLSLNVSFKMEELYRSFQKYSNYYVNAFIDSIDSLYMNFQYIEDLHQYYYLCSYHFPHLIKMYYFDFFEDSEDRRYTFYYDIMSKSIDVSLFRNINENFVETIEKSTTESYPLDNSIKHIVDMMYNKVIITHERVSRREIISLYRERRIAYTKEVLYLFANKSSIFYRLYKMRSFFNFFLDQVIYYLIYMKIREREKQGLKTSRWKRRWDTKYLLKPLEFVATEMEFNKINQN